MPTITRRRMLAATGAGLVAAAVGGDAVWKRAVDDAQAASTVSDPLEVTTTSYATLPGAAVPTVSVTSATTGTDTAISEGLLLAASNYGATGLLIADGAGSPVWWKPFATNSGLENFHVDTHRGEPVLVYYTGTVDSDLGFGTGQWHVLNTSYQEIATIRCGHGLSADLHDLWLRDDGTAVIEAYRKVRRDLSALGGRSDATVLESVIQRVDVSTGEVLSQWNSLEHIPVSATYADLDVDVLDYLHVNTLAAVPGDNDLVLVSARHASQVFALDLRTGTIRWRVGGRHPTLRVAGAQSAGLKVDGRLLPFSYQHDARLADDVLTVFDNGNQRDPGSSRAVSYRLDHDRGTATEIIDRTLTHQPAIYASSQGDVQDLASGRRLVSWGGLGYATVYSGTSPAVEIRGVRTYRMFCQSWSATPPGSPAMTVSAAGVRVSWNGATAVSTWRMMDAGTGRVLTEAARRSFETLLPLPTGARTVVVVALDASGAELGRSASTSLT